MVRRGLTATPRRLPPELFYDALGSRLFDAICELPEYLLTRAESALLDEHAAAMLGAPRRIVELGGGSGDRVVRLLGTARGRRPDVHLVDVSATALERAQAALASRRPDLTVRTHRASYEAGVRMALADRSADVEDDALVLFLGSNIGNFDDPDAARLLAEIRHALAPGDALLLGTDLVKPEKELLAAYSDPLGVTAAFNKNLLVRINRELGADFDVTRFDHLALWNRPRSSMDSYLVSRVAQEVWLPALQMSVKLEAGERIWTESSHKYTPATVRALAIRAGFRIGEQWMDARPNFAVSKLLAV